MATRSVYKAAVDTVTRNIDELAGCLAGDRTYYHDKAPSTTPARPRGD